MKKLVVGGHIRRSISDKLVHEHELVLLEPCERLDKPVASHADMQILCIDDNVIVTRSVYENNKSLRDAIACERVLFAKKEHGREYPSDVGLNALYFRGALYAKRASLDPTVIKLCENKCIEIINVAQGYTKCSTLALDDAIVTSDHGIAKAAGERGAEVLLITPGHVKLDGYDYGFIGGASYYDSDANKVYFFGDIDRHPDGMRIQEFILAHGYTFESIDSDVLTDYGGAVNLKKSLTLPPVCDIISKRNMR